MMMMQRRAVSVISLSALHEKEEDRARETQREEEAESNLRRMQNKKAGRAKQNKNH